MAALAASGEAAMSATSGTLNTAALALNGAAGAPGSRRSIGVDRGTEALASPTNPLVGGSAEARRWVGANASAATAGTAQLREENGL